MGEKRIRLSGEETPAEKRARMDDGLIECFQEYVHSYGIEALITELIPSIAVFAKSLKHTGVGRRLWEELASFLEDWVVKFKHSGAGDEVVGEDNAGER